MDHLVQHIPVPSSALAIIVVTDAFLLRLCRKFFTFVFTLNMIGIGLASAGHFPYAVRNSGAMVLGNLNFAIVSAVLNLFVCY